MSYRYKSHTNTEFQRRVKKVNPEVIKELLNGRQLDVLIGGIPCQGFSLNNRKRHENDDRNFMYKEFVLILQSIFKNYCQSHPTNILL